jgi:hypothetical protein
MFDGCRKLAIVAALGIFTLAGGLSGCSAMSANHVDCNVVRLQSEAGRSDAEIASAIGASEANVAACHGAEKSGNATSGAMSSPY